MIKKVTYIAVVNKDKDSDYGVSFPDLPGCVTAASSLDEALKEAQEVLQFHIDGILDDKEGLPASTSLDIIQKENMTALTFFAVQVKLKEKAIRVNITIDEGLLRKLDKYTKEHKIDRSSFISEVIRGRV